MTRSVRATFAGLALALLFTVSAPRATAQCVSLTTFGSAYSQNFDTLSNTAGSTTNNLTIPGWFMTETGGGARDNEQYGVDTGASNTGDTYSYGAAASTDRALGALRSGTLIPNFGACFTNNTGGTITSLAVAYTGEEWRLGTAARTDQLGFQYSTNATDLVTGSWTSVAALNFVTPDTATVGAKNGNAAADRTALSSTISGLSVANGATFWIRWTDTDATSSDDGLAVDDFSLTPSGSGGGGVSLSINDVSLEEGNSGTTSFAFTVTLSAPAPAGGVTFDVATGGGTATAGSDYTAVSLTGQSIAEGGTTATITVSVLGDSTPEPNETFFVNVTNVVGTGATIGDGQGQGTIVNDDFSLTPIHSLQGTGATSPFVGLAVTTTGVVTGVKTNGFFLQEPDATADADPATSEGIFVFTSSTPPAAAAVGNLVRVAGTVQEFIPAADPLSPPTTELTGPTVTLLSTGNPLPTPAVLSPVLPSPSGAFDQLERLEGMRVQVDSLTVVSPTEGSLSEANATSTSNGVFWGVVTGLTRPFREPGIQAPEVAPSGTIPPIPRYDGNPEVLRVDSDGLVGGTAVDVSSGAVVTGLVGPLDYSSRHYTIALGAGSPASVSGGVVPAAAAAAGSREATVGSWNLERFYDTVNDAGVSDVALTSTALDLRLGKASVAIRQFLRLPDILAVMEAENISVLQTLAAKISTDAIGAGEPDPKYAAYLAEGNDIGGIDVGFLVKSAPAFGSTPRVTVVEVVQENKNETYVDPGGGTAILNDRPPLRLSAVVNGANGGAFPITVIANHLRSLSDISDPASGARVRSKRQKQAESLANLVQARQAANAAERILLVGDFNAYEFSDGYVDVMGTVAGTPTPADQVVLASGDLVGPDLVNLSAAVPAAERYSFLFDGSAQSLDHALANASLVAGTATRRVEHVRISSDFPETARNVASSPTRLSDHDPLVAYFTVPAFSTSNLSTTASVSPAGPAPGTTVVFSATVSAAGPDPATSVTLAAVLPAGLTFVSFPAPAGWSCTTPAVGASGAISCAAASLAPGTVSFTLTAGVPSATAPGSAYSVTFTAGAATTDPTAADLSATATATVLSPALLSARKTAFGFFAPGGDVTYRIVVTNGLGTAQPDNPGDELVDVLPAGLELAGASADSGVVTVDVPSRTVRWNGQLPGLGSVTILIQARIAAGAQPGTTISNQAILSFDADGNGTNESTVASDDPSRPGAADPTAFALVDPAAIPLLDARGLAALAALLAAAGLLLLRGRGAA